ncbi:hypothetical protein MKZ38_000736 [Zalerion maritima]|uniref:NADH dehydrogenase [ubiquinone] 1 beta subcomplex subunit 7 n=1 Tax=Zalerion maritima TaxID=339359 RepID=A0AAD5WMM8_9PEZI|nr:hypothetical protein MKZ38_000736 [Zalerion maritima]
MARRQSRLVKYYRMVQGTIVRTYYNLPIGVVQCADWTDLPGNAWTAACLLTTLPGNRQEKEGRLGLHATVRTSQASTEHCQTISTLRDEEEWTGRPEQRAGCSDSAKVENRVAGWKHVVSDMPSDVVGLYRRSPTGQVLKLHDPCNLAVTEEAGNERSSLNYPISLKMGSDADGEPPRRATREEMREAKLPLPYRDSCAHLLIPLNRCRFENYYLPWKCVDERHSYEKCQYDEFKERVAKMEELRASKPGGRSN